MKKLMLVLSGLLILTTVVSASSVPPTILADSSHLLRNWIIVGIFVVSFASLFVYLGRRKPSGSCMPGDADFDASKAKRHEEYYREHPDKRPV